MTSTILPIHPRTGLQAVGVVNGRPVWPVLGAEDPPEPSGDPASDPPKPGPSTTQPPHDPEPAAATFTQADVDRIVKQRADRIIAQKYGDYDEIKRKAAEADQLRQQQETDAEKAIREAADKARAEALAELRPKLAAAEFKAAAAGRIDAERLATLTEDIDMSRYLTDDGDVNTEKVAAKVAAWAPPQEPRIPKPDPSQGSGRPPALTGAEKGLAEAARRFGTPQTART